MPNARDVLTPDTLALLQAVARAGSFAAAARELGLVPSAVTYRVRLVEEALDALLFDRSSRQARLTDAGRELLREGERLLEQVDAVANRVRRVATGWETQLTLSIDGLIARETVLELCQAFFDSCPPTRLRLRDEVLTGTVEALRMGQADLALGFAMDPGTLPDLDHRPLGDVPFLFAVAPHHPLAQLPEPLSEETLRVHRAVAVADSTQRGLGMSIGLLAGQEVFTVPTMALKLDAQLRGLGAGFLPEPAARPFIETGRLVVRRTERAGRIARLHYAWRAGSHGPGQGLQWWLTQLESPATRRALLDRRRGASLA